MSTIPNSAMPHAQVSEPQSGTAHTDTMTSQGHGSEVSTFQSISRGFSDQVSSLTQLVRDNPKTAIAVGAGVTAAVAAPFILHGRSSNGRKSNGKGSGSKSH